MVTYDKIALWTAAIITGLASFIFLIVGLYQIGFGHDKILGIVSFVVGVILGSYIKDYGRMIREN